MKTIVAFIIAVGMFILASPCTAGNVAVTDHGSYVRIVWSTYWGYQYYSVTMIDHTKGGTVTWLGNTFDASMTKSGLTRHSIYEFEVSAYQRDTDADPLLIGSAYVCVGLDEPGQCVCNCPELPEIPPCPIAIPIHYAIAEDPYSVIVVSNTWSCNAAVMVRIGVSSRTYDIPASSVRLIDIADYTLPAGAYPVEAIAINPEQQSGIQLEIVHRSSDSILKW